MEAPDNASAVALAMAVGSGGALSGIETTVLLDMDEAQDAMRKAAAAPPVPHIGCGNGGDGARGTRTPDLLGAIQALSQLSYSPAVRAPKQEFSRRRPTDCSRGHPRLGVPRRLGRQGCT